MQQMILLWETAPQNTRLFSFLVTIRHCEASKEDPLSNYSILDNVFV